MHYLFLRLKLGRFSNKTDLCALSFSVDGILEADIEIELDFATVFSFKAEPVDNVALPLLVDVLGPYHLLKFVYSDGTAQEETVNFRVEGSSWSPRFSFDLMVSSFLWQSHECVTFNSVPTPAVDWVDLKEDVRSAFQVIVLGYELKV